MVIGNSLSVLRNSISEMIECEMQEVVMTINRRTRLLGPLPFARRLIGPLLEKLGNFEQLG